MISAIHASLCTIKAFIVAKLGFCFKPLPYQVHFQARIQFPYLYPLPCHLWHCSTLLGFFLAETSSFPASLGSDRIDHRQCGRFSPDDLGLLLMPFAK